MIVKLPYGKKPFEVEVPDGSPVLLSRKNEMTSDKSGVQITMEALMHPIGSPRLSELAKGKQNIVILISDQTRIIPSREFMPQIFEEIWHGNPDAEITFLVACGTHRPPTEDELRIKLGDDIYDGFPIVLHDSTDKDSHVLIGHLKSGNPLYIDRVAAEADLLIAEGAIEPHIFAGFSGGRKSILPGVALRESILANHCGENLANPYARAGSAEKNPVSIEMAEAAELSGLAFILNIIVSDNRQTVAAFAGAPAAAHKAGCEYIMEYCGVKQAVSDICLVTNGGAPKDGCVYQCAKSVCAAGDNCREGGVIILCGECPDGHGGKDFYDALCKCTSAAALYDELCRRPCSETVMDQWEMQLFTRQMRNKRVIFVSEEKNKQMIEDMKFEYAATPQEAIEMAKTTVGDTPTFTVIPDAISVAIEII